jgi:hypothetical protein
MALLKIFLPLIFLTIFPLCGIGEMRLIANNSYFQQWEKFSGTGGAILLSNWLHCQSKEISGLEKCRMVLVKNIPDFSGKLGVFITITKEKSVRGCYGSFDHKADNSQIILLEYLRGALYNDPRYKPVGIDEMDNIKIILTIAERPFAIRSLETLDLSKYGIMIQDQENRSWIIVPGEIKSLELLKRKISHIKVIELYAFRALSIHI